jgi:hypothetical protein
MIWHQKEAIYRKDPDPTEEIIDPFSGVQSLGFIFSSVVGTE